MVDLLSILKDKRCLLQSKWVKVDFREFMKGCIIYGD